MYSSFEVELKTFDIDILDMYLVVVTLPSETDRPAKYKYQVPDGINMKNEYSLDLSKLNTDSEFETDHPLPQAILFTQFTEVDKNVILNICKLLGEVKPGPRTKNWLFDIIKWPYPILMLLIVWHWALEDENVYSKY